MSKIKVDLSNDYPTTITTDVIRQSLNELDLYSYYLGHAVEPKQMYKAPDALRLRHGFSKDNTPSFQIYLNKKNHYVFKDHGCGIAGDIFTLVSILHGLNLYESCLKIAEDFGLYGQLKKRDFNRINEFKKPKIKKQRKVIQIEQMDFTSKVLDYFSEGNISKSTLNTFYTYQANKVYINKKLVQTHKEDDPIIAYYYNKKEGHNFVLNVPVPAGLATTGFKTYRPFSKEKKYKFLSSVHAYCLDGLHTLNPRNPDLIITKSRKDAMCLYEAGYNAISPPGEGHYIPTEFLESLFTIEKFRPIVFYDNDEAGYSNSLRLFRTLNKIFYSLKTEEDLDLIYSPRRIEINPKFKCKDAFDLVVKEGLLTLVDFLNYEHVTRIARK